MNHLFPITILFDLVSSSSGRILVAGSRCHLRDFNVSTGFTCILDKVRFRLKKDKIPTKIVLTIMTLQGTGSGPVRVAIGHSARRTAESANVFSFHNVEVRIMFFSEEINFSRVELIIRR